MHLIGSIRQHKNHTLRKPIHCSWRYKDSCILNGVIDFDSKDLGHYIKTIPPTIFPPSQEELLKGTKLFNETQLAKQLNKEIYFNCLHRKKNNVWEYVNRLTGSRPRRATFGVLMFDKNKGYNPRMVCLPKIKDPHRMEALNQSCRPLPMKKFILPLAVYKSIYTFLMPVSQVCPPNIIQEIFYYGVYKSGMGFHKDHLFDGANNYLPGSNTIVISIFAPAILGMKHDTNGDEFDIQLNHLDVWVLGPDTDSTIKHRIHFPYDNNKN